MDTAFESVASREHFVLRDGRHVSVRSIEPEDAAALVRFHEALSEQSKRFRFFSPHPHLTEEEIRRFTQVDGDHREAFVATHAGEIVGVGRFDATASGTGEVAFVIRDDWQGIGLGSLLLRYLGGWARAKGITKFEADVLGDNRAMLRVFGAWCPERVLSIDHGIVHVDMPIKARPDYPSGTTTTGHSERRTS